MLRISVMMLLQFFIWGAWYSTVANYLIAHEWSDFIGRTFTAAPIAAIISPFFLGIVADRFFSTERVLGVLHILGGIAICCAPMAAQHSYDALFGVLLLHMLCYMPTLGLTNTLAFHHLDNQEKQFPLVRVFGTIGWIVAGIVVSWWLEGDKTDTPFYVAGIASFALGIYSFSLPHTPPPAKGTKLSLRKIAGVDAFALLKQPSFAVFMACSFLLCIPLAGYYSFGQVYLGKIGFPAPAFTLTYGQWTEVFFILAMPLLFSRLGVKWMLAIGMVAWILRYLLFSAADANNVQWMIIAGILLHGICYDFFFVTGFIYTDKKCTPEMRGQAQGLLVFVTQGLGLGLGALAMQEIVNWYPPAEAGGANDWQAIWLWPCAFAAAILVIFVLFFKDDTDKKPG